MLRYTKIEERFDCKTGREIVEIFQRSKFLYSAVCNHSVHTHFVFDNRFTTGDELFRAAVADSEQ